MPSVAASDSSVTSETTKSAATHVEKPELLKDTPAASSPRRSLATTLRHRVLNITPAWFAVNMGTGISSILLHNLPYNADWLRIIATCIFALNVIIFVILAVMTTARYLIWPKLFMVVLDHPLQSLFWGTLPMGLATIVNMLVYVCVPAWGSSFVQLARAIWWIDVLLSVLIGFGVPFVMFSRQTQSLDSMNGVWLQPVVAAVVAAASGGVLATVLEPQAARSTIIISYVVWGTGVPFALLIMAMYFYRLAVKGLPSGGATPSILLPLGPCGQGAFGIIQLGKVVRTLAYEHDLGLTTLPEGVVPGSEEARAIVRHVADSVYVGGLVVGCIMWGVGLFWLVIAVSTIIKQLQKGFPFTIGCWAFTFPLGVFSVGTTTLAMELESPAFKVIGTITSLCVVSLWVFVSTKTLMGSITGTIFTAAELAPWGGNAPPRTSAKQVSDV